MRARSRRTLLVILAALSWAQASGQDGPFEVLLWAHARDRRPKLLAAAARVGFSAVNVGGGEDPSFAGRAGLAVYVDPALPKGILALSEQDWRAGLARTLAEPPDLTRPVSLLDPQVALRAGRALRHRLAPMRHLAPLFVSIGDELSYTLRLNPIDWCPGQATDPGFRAFLKKIWTSERAWRQGWGLPARGGDPLTFATTNAARHAFLHAGRPTRALVRWNDTRSFADATFAGFLRDMARHVRSALPGVPVALLGGEMPSAFGGYDWENLLTDLDVAEPYDHGATPALVDSISSGRIDRYRTIMIAKRSVPEILAELDQAFFRGARGVIFYSSAELFGKGRDPHLLAALQARIKLLNSPPFQRFRRARSLRPQVAVLHSMPSVRLHWMLDAAGDGAAWPNRTTSFETTHATQARTRASWLALLEDLGLETIFVTPRQIRGGILRRLGLRALVLPRTIALGDATAGIIKTFVGRGGLLIGDAREALFAEHLQERQEGALDRVFGIQRLSAAANLVAGRLRHPATERVPYPVAEAGVKAREARSLMSTQSSAILLTRGFQQGHTFYLNLLVLDYLEDRLRHPGKAAWLRHQLRVPFLKAGLQPRILLQPSAAPPPWPLGLHLRRGALGLVLVVRASPGRGSPPAKPKDRRPCACEARLWRPFHVVDLITGRSLGRRARIPLKVAPDSPAIFSLITNN